MRVILCENFEAYLRCCYQNGFGVGQVPWIKSVSEAEKIRTSVQPIYFGHFWKNPAHKEIERVLKSKGIRVQTGYVNPKALNE